MAPTYQQEQTDAQLLARVARHDRVAFDALFRRYERRSLGYARQLLRDVTAAEDVMIEALSTVWTKASSFHGDSQVSTWILGIVRHKALDRLRADGRHSQDGPIDGAEQLADPSAGPEDSLAEADASHVINSAFHRLSADHQEVLRLAFFEDLPYGEIARLLGIPANTVKTRVYHAKLKLKHALVSAGQKVDET